jgi:F-type H+-transporting ATPase subunit gamma
MASLKEVRNRIVSVNSTKQITSAMKMVSAAKLRRAQDAIIRMRPYAEKLGQIMGNVSAGLDRSESKYGQAREEKRVLIVAITSNRGLAGAFNSQVTRTVKKLVAESKVPVEVLCIGKKAMDMFKRTPEHAAGLPTDLAKLYDGLNFDSVAPVAELLMEKFSDGTYDRIVLVYNKFKNAATQIISTEQFLPIVSVGEEGSEASSTTEHIMEPDRATIVEQIIPKSLKIQLYKALLDSFAAEHGARMTSMHKATDNADSMLKELKLSYNKARQAAITGEILEIVGGAEALKG